MGFDFLNSDKLNLISFVSRTSQPKHPFVMMKFSHQNVRLLSDELISGNKLQQQFVIAWSNLTKEILIGIYYCLNAA